MRKKLDKNYWLFRRPLAHRGLYDNVTLPENSLPAYENAIKNNFGIELDVQMTKDGELVVFHDDNVNRMCGVDRDIREMTFEEVRKLRLKNTDCQIKTFREVLDFIDGRTGILIEIKHQLYKGIEEKIIAELKGYDGDFALQSFIPYIMTKVRKLAPEYVSGMLSTLEYSPLASKFINYAMHHFWFKLMLNCDFYNIRVCDLKKVAKYTKDRPKICWTVRSEEDKLLAEKYADNYIFELY